MAESTGLALTVGAVTLANEMVLNPVAHGKDIDLTQGWNVIPATALFALILAGVEQLPGPSSKILAKGIAGIALITVIFTAPSVKAKPALGAGAAEVVANAVLTGSPVQKLATIAKIGNF